MRYTLYPAAVLASFIGLASPCNAQNARSFVSGVGSDSNGCTRTAPCQTFAAALSKTGANGEIDCLDAGEFGSATITQPVSIVCDGVNGGIIGTFPFASVVVNLSQATDSVLLSGLHISNAIGGVLMKGTGNLTIRNSTIRSTNNAGVEVQSSSPAQVTILNSLFERNAVGVDVSSASGTRVFIQDSFIKNNAVGVSVNASGGTNAVAISHTVIDGNSQYALGVGGAGNSVALENDILSGSATGITSAGGVVNSFGQSNVITGAGSPTASTPLR